VPRSKKQALHLVFLILPRIKRQPPTVSLRDPCKVRDESRRCVAHRAARYQQFCAAPQHLAHRLIRITARPDDIKDDVSILDQANLAQALLAV
jgi:hypothetical protein